VRRLGAIWLVSANVACASNAPRPSAAAVPADQRQEVCGVGGLGRMVPEPGGAPDVAKDGRRIAAGLPGTPPRLEGITWGKPGKAGILAASVRFSGTHRPVHLVAYSSMPEYRFRVNSCSAEAVQVSFMLVCKRDRSAHTVDYRFRIEDSLGRESNVVEHRLECPGSDSHQARGEAAD
jgi:hypothetical protein